MPELKFFKSLFRRSETFNNNNTNSNSSPKAAAYKSQWKAAVEEPVRLDRVINLGPPASLRRSSTTAGHRHTMSTPAGRLSEPLPAKKVVIYTTSLRSIRRTYDDCQAVRAIFKGLGVAVDERDLSMDLSFRRELQILLGGRAMALPRVFIGRKYFGGIDEIRNLHETGELTKYLKGIDREAPGFVCHACNGMRFLPCSNCNGSRRVFDEEEETLTKCFFCNENGLVRCPDCY